MEEERGQDDEELEYDDEVEEEAEKEEPQSGVKRPCGKNTDYKQAEHFKTTKEFEDSDLKVDLEKYYNLRKSKSFLHCEREIY